MKNDPVNNPKHYNTFPGQQSIDLIKATLTPEEFQGFLKGNFLKYRFRAGAKDDLKQDIDKSNWYRDRLFENELPPVVDRKLAEQTQRSSHHETLRS